MLQRDWTRFRSARRQAPHGRVRHRFRGGQGHEGHGQEMASRHGAGVNPALGGLTEQYSLALRDYFADGGEAALGRAYELGRQAQREGLGVLEMAALHQAALAAVLRRRSDNASLAQRAAEVFTESLAPFEMASRCFQEA